MTPCCPWCGSIKVVDLNKRVRQCKRCEHKGVWKEFDPLRQENKIWGAAPAVSLGGGSTQRRAIVTE